MGVRPQFKREVDSSAAMVHVGSEPDSSAGRNRQPRWCTASGPAPGFASSPQLKQKRQPSGCLSRDRRRPALLGGLGRALAGVALLELVHAPGGVDDLLLAGVERVGLRRDLDLVDRILLAIL